MSFTRGHRGVVLACAAVLLATLTLGAAPEKSQVALWAQSQPVNAFLPKSNVPAIFVAQLYSREILLLDAQGHLLSKIIARYQSSSLATDGAGDLYVANNGKENAIEVYSAPKYLVSSITLPQGAQATGVAVDARSGIFAVMSAHVRSKTEVSFFRQGAVKPCRVVTERLGGFVFGGAGAFDRGGTLYAAIKTGNGDAVASVSGECGEGSVQVLTFKQPFQVYSGFMFNASDEFVIQEILSPNSFPIDTYMHPMNGRVGDPVATTNLALYRGNQQYFARLSTDGQHLIAGGYHDVAQYDYPLGGQPNWVVTGIAGMSDAAVNPPLASSLGLPIL